MGVGVQSWQEGPGLGSVPPYCVPPTRQHGDTSSQTHYFRKFPFQGSKLPLLDCKLPQVGNQGYDFLASLRRPSGALELSRLGK